MYLLLCNIMMIFLEMFEDQNLILQGTEIQISILIVLVVMKNDY